MNCGHAVCWSPWPVRFVDRLNKAIKLSIVQSNPMSGNERRLAWTLLHAIDNQVGALDDRQSSLERLELLAHESPADDENSRSFRRPSSMRPLPRMTSSTGSHHRSAVSISVEGNSLFFDHRVKSLGPSKTGLSRRICDGPVY